MGKFQGCLGHLIGYRGIAAVVDKEYSCKGDSNRVANALTVRDGWFGMQ